MKRIEGFCTLAIVLAFFLTTSGCGRDTTPVIVGGNDPKYQRPADAEAAYMEAMSQSRKSANRSQ
ncbi:MAG: hypothetical protein AAF670_06070 [Planctomycetota bacterium]